MNLCKLPIHQLTLSLNDLDSLNQPATCNLFVGGGGGGGGHWDSICISDPNWGEGGHWEHVPPPPPPSPVPTPMLKEVTIIIINFKEVEKSCSVYKILTS